MDVLIYWRDYQQNWVRRFAGEQGFYWHSNARLIGKLTPGDRIRLVTSGKCLREEAAQAGFLGLSGRFGRSLRIPATTRPIRPTNTGTA